MRPILFSIGHLHFYGYGLMIALGIILAVCVAERRAGRFGLDSSKIFGLGITAAVSGIIGAEDSIRNYRNSDDYPGSTRIFQDPDLGRLCGLWRNHLWHPVLHVLLPPQQDGFHPLL